MLDTLLTVAATVVAVLKYIGKAAAIYSQAFAAARAAYNLWNKMGKVSESAYLGVDAQH